MQKRIIGLFCALLVGCTAVLAGCGDGASTDSATSTGSAQTASVTESSGAEASEGSETETLELGDQLDKPEKGEEIAVIETTKGTIKMRLFPQAAPKTVANFKKLAEDGIYDGLDFHRIIDGFMIQTGQSASTSIYGDYFEDEFSEALLNLRGAVSMANISQANTNSTQFFINQTPADKFGGWDNIIEGYRVYIQNPTAFTQTYGSWPDLSRITPEIKELYVENGGNPSLDGAYSTTGLGHTVFGQVFEGMDVVDEIAKAKTDANDAPVSDDYKIKHITFETYQG